MQLVMQAIQSGDIKAYDKDGKFLFGNVLNAPIKNNNNQGLIMDKVARLLSETPYDRDSITRDSKAFFKDKI